jgi:hypothetical protein
MLSLFTLEKLVKLELVALRKIGSCIYQHITLSGIAKEPTDALRAELNDFALSVRLYAESIGFDISDAAMSIRSKGFDVRTMQTANPNRFVKSSFALSLLWCAKFYRVITDSYGCMSKYQMDSHHYYFSCSYALSCLLSGLKLPLSHTTVNIDRWVKDNHPWLPKFSRITSSN